MNYICKLLKGYIIAFIIFFCFTIISTLLVKFTTVPEKYLFYYLIVSLTISTLFLGIFSGKLIGKRGLLSSLGLSALFVFLIIFAITCTYFKELSIHTFDILYILPIIIGGIGGIIGVNVKK